MTAGKNVLDAITPFPPGADVAPPRFITGGSTPAELIEAYVFADAATTYMDFSCLLSGDYAGGGINVRLSWSASVNTNNTLWSVAVRRLQENTTDFTAAHTYVYTDLAGTAPGTVGQYRNTTVAMGNGAPIDSLAAGEPFVLRVRRLGADGLDTMVGDAELWWHLIRIYEQ